MKRIYSILISFFLFQFLNAQYEGYSEESWDEFRIKNMIPWFGNEISDSIHPLACGLDRLVHHSKGCYVGQEVIARMRSRGRQGKELVRISNAQVNKEEVTTRGVTNSLVIRRTQ